MTAPVREAPCLEARIVSAPSPASASAETGPFRLDLTLRVPPGVTVLFGPSGAGKSRTLGVIAGLETPAVGRVALGDDVWLDVGSAGRVEGRIVKPIHERRVAYVFQSLALFPHLTAAENVAFGLPRETPAPKRAVLARETLERMHVGHLASRRPATFSGGEAQRVALARAFAMSPSTILLDEPFSALDDAVKRELLAEVRERLVEAHVPTLLVTHRRDEARALGERVLFIDHGRVVRESTIADAWS